MSDKPRIELARVAASPEFMLNGVAVSPRGRVFASFPRWTSLAAPSVMEAMPDGSSRFAYVTAGAEVVEFYCDFERRV